MSIFNNFFNIKESTVNIIGLTNPLKALYIYNYFISSNKSVLVVTSTLYEANKFYQELSSYTQDALLFPMDSFLNSEALAISPELKNTRLETLRQITVDKKIVITNLMGYLRYLPTNDIFLSSKIELFTGLQYNKDTLIEKLISIGYMNDSVVEKTGSFASRGYIIDVFPISEKNPIRLEYWGDEIDNIREFDINTQLTIRKIESIVIYPNTEFLINSIIDTDKISQRMLPSYIEPTNIYGFMNKPFVFFNDYDAIIESKNDLEAEVYNYNLSINQNYNYMNNFNDINIKEFKNFINFDNAIHDSLSEVYQSKEIENFKGTIDEINKRLLGYINNNKTVIICFSDRFKVNKFLDNMENEFIIFTSENEIMQNKINVIIKNLKNGFECNNYIFISESEIYNKKNDDIKYKSHFTIGSKIHDINKLNVGDYIVHYAHGIGRYLGIKSLTKGSFKKDYLELEYKDGDKLYVPVEKIELINKYSANEGLEPKINKLGSTEWAKTKLKVRKKVESIAEDLLKLYAERESSYGIKFDSDSKEQIEFEKLFQYNETLDQLRVTEEIKKDMESFKPMDRLVCGDVGYGKTEIAFRAAFKAIISGYQVAMLCPTTILSSQHFNTALNRFSSFAINIRLLNRFTTTKETKKILEDLSTGRVDFVIGTHRVLSSDINFKKLGLLIIDEEQRFGVKHKEKIKSFKNNIDVLTLSATPIPRTLQMSMSGLRSLSLLETPPIDRYPVQTYVISQNDHIIKEAIYKELSRNGQVFILYNSVISIEKKLFELSKLVPDAKIAYIHGKMNKNDIEKVMLDFINRVYDVLLCTTIIESGIDIQNANTLIVFDADKFGLSQLYQLRGRVGRSNKIAYCYLMYDKYKVLSEVAIKRLNAIKEFTELGSGFSIAVRDLSIRGAGDILGSEQAGFVNSVGVELFLSMLNDEISRKKGEKVNSFENIPSTPLLDVSTSISDDYVSSESLKIEIHKMINSIDSYQTLEKVKSQIEDRFGHLSEEMNIYMHEELFEKKARELGIEKLNQTKNYIEVLLPPILCQKINIEQLFFKASELTRMFRFSMKNKNLSIVLDTVKLDKNYIFYLIDLCEVIKSLIN
ncbi:MAG: transcription-repair coupling factor [Clostridium sp.]|nr:transcription-repair coupling factor [Clostridium sp.]MCM1443786.1 transcription-repair coupling factor [Candidatus Amulumruptor caecigallinarius]